MRKLGVIITSIVASIVVVVGVVFAGVWVINQPDVPDNDFTVGDPIYLELKGEAMGGTVRPGDVVESEEFEIRLENVDPGTYNVYLSVNESTTVTDTSYWWISVKKNNGDYTTAVNYDDLADGVLLAGVEHGDKFFVKVEFRAEDPQDNENIPLDVAGQKLSFNLTLAKSN